LDVALATVNAGQATNVASTDSLAFLSALLDLQAVMGLDARGVVVTLTDSLTVPPSVPAELPDDSAARASALPLQVAAAQATFESARLATRLQHHSLFGTPSLTAGVEAGDPTRAEPGFLPTVGIALPFPLFNRNRGSIAQAEADQARARAELAFAKRQSDTELARLRRELTIALAKIARDSLLITAADRVATMSLTAYREGASALPNVLEAQRNARDVLAQHVDDLASAWIASAELRVLTLTSAHTAP
jgi:cobalt-zinc-cadmium efflux system outer membrane protein